MRYLTNDEMDEITRDLGTKSEKIRTLGRAGVRPADIARFLGIRYQHAYNVLRDANLGTTRHGTGEPAAAESAGPAKAVLDESGCIRIPDDVLRAWSAKPGDELIIRVEGDELRVLTRRAGLALARDIARKYIAPGDNLADELVGERRLEAAHEDG